MNERVTTEQVNKDASDLRTAADEFDKIGESLDAAHDVASSLRKIANRLDTLAADRDEWKAKYETQCAGTMSRIEELTHVKRDRDAAVTLAERAERERDRAQVDADVLRATAVDQRTKLAAANAECERLPKTTNGVRFVPCIDYVWVPDCVYGAVRVLSGHRNTVGVKCYSTREAALAASDCASVQDQIIEGLTEFRDDLKAASEKKEGGS